MADPLATPAASTSRSGGSPPALRVEGLRKTYEDGFTAVDGLDLAIPGGAFFGLLGPNGAGKTTLIGSVCNIVRPTAGTLSVFGHDHRSRQARRLLGPAAQETNVDRFPSIRPLVQLDTVHRDHLDAAAVQRVADHPTLWAHGRRLAVHPALGGHLDLDGTERRHRAHCRGLEDAGAAIRILDWTAYAALWPFHLVDRR